MTLAPKSDSETGAKAGVDAKEASPAMRRAGAPKPEASAQPPATTTQPKPPEKTEPKLPAQGQTPTMPPPAPTSDPKLWSAKLHIWIGMIGLLILVGGFGVWAVFSNIAGAIIATGQIELEQNRQVVQHPDGGVVEKIMVREGDSVKAGDVLIKLDANRLKSELLIIEGELFEIVSRSARLEAERDETDEIKFPDLLAEAAVTRPEISDLMRGQERLFRARLNNAEQTVEQLKKRKSQIANQVEGVAAQQDALVTQLSLLKEELDAQQDLLAKGLAQAGRVLALQREDARLQGQVGELTATVAENEGRITEIDIQILQLDTQRKEDAITALRDLQIPGV